MAGGNYKNNSKITVKLADKVITPSKYFRDLVANWNPQRQCSHRI